MPESPLSNIELTSRMAGLAWPALLFDQGAQFLALGHQLEASQWWSPNRLWRHQSRQLALLLRHALATVPHYRRSFGGHALDPDRIDRAGFAELPLLERSQLQQQYEQLRSQQLPPGHGPATESFTSGSTGTPLRFLTTELRRLFWQALNLRHHLWHKRDFSGKFAAIRTNVTRQRQTSWGGALDWIMATGPSVTLNIAADLREQADWLLEEAPDYLITHPSNAVALARFFAEQRLPPPPLREILTFGEALRADTRTTLREIWNLPAKDIYSSEECGYLALQCPEHEHYHVQEECAIVEILDDAGNPCPPGETGRVVVTLLHNFAMPLIRYAIGDYAEVGPPCPCGRGLQVLTKIHGRQRNMAVSPDGRCHWPSFPAEMWLEIAPVRQFQLVQRSAAEIEVRYVMDRELDADEMRRLAQALHERLRFPFRFDWRRYARIERGANCKFEDFVSLVAPTTSTPSRY